MLGYLNGRNAEIESPNTETGDSVQKTPVIPAKAGIHFATVKNLMDSRLRGNDNLDDADITHLGNAE